VRRRVYGFGTVPNSSPTPSPNIAVTITACPTVVQRGVTIVNGTPVYTCTASVSNSSNYGCHLDEQLNIVIEDRFVDRCAHATVARIGHCHGDLSSRYHKVGFGDNQGCGPPVHFAGRAAPWLPGLNGMLLFYLETDGSDSAELLTTRECWDPRCHRITSMWLCGTFVIPTDSVHFKAQN